jgi:hypothetical protein
MFGQTFVTGIKIFALGNPDFLFPQSVASDYNKLSPSI